MHDQIPDNNITRQCILTPGFWPMGALGMHVGCIGDAFWMHVGCIGMHVDAFWMHWDAMGGALYALDLTLPSVWRPGFQFS